MLGFFRLSIAWDVRLDVINGTADVQLCFDERLVEAEQRILVSHHAISVPGHVKLERMQSVYMYLYINHNPATADHVGTGTCQCTSQTCVLINKQLPSAMSQTSMGMQLVGTRNYM